MKKLFVVLSSFSLLTFGAMAAELKGTISDAKCGAAHADASEKSMKCVAGCVKGGQAPVLVTEDGKVLKISDAAKVQEHLGHKVIVTGNVDGDTVKIDSVKMQ
ncbi:MAG: DUF5818 domain-containing protein [Bryobacteraceae bacterium]